MWGVVFLGVNTLTISHTLSMQRAKKFNFFCLCVWLLVWDLSYMGVVRLFMKAKFHLFAYEYYVYMVLLHDLGIFVGDFWQIL